MDLSGKTIGQYQILSELGRGGMGVVYRARQPSLNRDVAIKVLPPALAFDREFVARFEHEARAAAALRHPNIVVIYDVGSQDDLHYIVMELVAGEPLDRLLDAGKPLAPERVLHIARQIAEALDYAHEHGFVHRDVKPANLLVGRKDHVTLMDFGLARAGDAAGLTRTGMVFGTPGYMAPEQIRGEPVDRRTDLYAFGVVLYELLTGVRPFRRSTPQAVLFAQVNEPPPPMRDAVPDLPDDVEHVILRALAKNPPERYATGAALVDALEQAVAGAARAAREQTTSAHRVAPVAVQHPEAPPALEPPTLAPDAAALATRRHAARSLQPRWLLAGLAVLALIALVVVVIVASGDFPLRAIQAFGAANAPAATATAEAGAQTTAIVIAQLTQNARGQASPTAGPTNTPASTPQPTATPSPPPSPTSVSTECPDSSPYQLDGTRLAALGCPAQDFVTDRTVALQAFANGLMVVFSTADGNLAPGSYIYALANDGRAWRISDTFVEPSTDPDTWYTCDAQPGQSPGQSGVPWRGFGKAWCEHPELRATLGAAAGEEYLGSASFQSYKLGRAFQVFDVTGAPNWTNARVYVVYLPTPDGDFIAGRWD
jgi:predicted Ser/Thr protein kinase